MEQSQKKENKIVPLFQLQKKDPLIFYKKKKKKNKDSLRKINKTSTTAISTTLGCPVEGKGKHDEENVKESNKKWDKT